LAEARLAEVGLERVARPVAHGWVSCFDLFS
jgi:hypothetical protein